MAKYIITLEINESDLLAEWDRMGSKNNHDIPLLIHSSLYYHYFEGLERIVEIQKIEPPNYIKTFQEVGAEYLTEEIREDFFVLSPDAQYEYLKDHACEVYEDYSGEHLFDMICDYARGKFIAKENKYNK